MLLIKRCQMMLAIYSNIAILNWRYFKISIAKSCCLGLASFLTISCKNYYIDCGTKINFNKDLMMYMRIFDEKCPFVYASVLLFDKTLISTPIFQTPRVMFATSSWSLGSSGRLPTHDNIEWAGTILSLSGFNNHPFSTLCVTSGCK